MKGQAGIMKKWGLCIVVAVFLISIIHSSSNAAQITTDAVVELHDYDNNLINDVADSDSGSNSTSSSADNSDPETATISKASATGTADGHITAQAEWSAPAGGIYYTEGSVSWTESFVALTSGNYNWNFSIPTGTLAVGGNNSGDNLFAGYYLSIAANDVILWNSSATLTMFDGGDYYEYDTTGDSLGGTVTAVENYYGSTIGYRIDFGSYAGVIDLGMFYADNEIKIKYNMSAFAGGPGAETSASAFIGDPGTLTGGGGMSGNLELAGSPQAAPVPEPATIFLLGSGIIGIIGSSRKKLKK